MPERTVHTSVLIASLASMVSDAGRRRATIQESYGVLRELITKVCSEGSFTVFLWDMQGLVRRECKADRDGTVDGRLVWGGDCPRSRRLINMWTRQVELLWH